MTEPRNDPAAREAALGLLAAAGLSEPRPCEHDAAQCSEDFRAGYGDCCAMCVH